MSDAIHKAMAESQRSYMAAKATVAGMANELLTNSRGGLPIRKASMGNAEEQYRHFRGWVYSAVRPIAQRIAGQPIHVGKVTNGKPRTARSFPDDVEPIEQHPLLDVLNDPNELMVRWSLMFATVASLELTGRQLWWMPELDGRRLVFPIPSSWIVGTEGTTAYKGFRIRPPGTAEATLIGADEVAYFVYPDPSNPHGALSPLQATAAAVDADEAIQASQVAAFHRGIHPTHALLLGSTIGPDGKNLGRPTMTSPQRRQLIDSVRQIYAGATKAGEPLILDGLIEDVKTLSSTPREMDWTKSSTALKERIAQTFGTNPVIMGQLEGANRASSLAAEDHFCKFTVNPKIELLSQTLTEWVGPLFAKKGERLVIWIEPCLPRDDELELAKWQLAIGAGAVTYDEVRTVLNLPPLPFGGGDTVGAQNAMGVAIRSKLAEFGMGELVSRSINSRMRINGHAIGQDE